MKRLPRSGCVLLAASLALAALLVLSEWREMGWWSKVRGIGKSPYQNFAVLYSAELRIGWRGSAGFFNRYIPPPGFMFDRTSPLKWESRALIPGIKNANQTQWLTLPFWPVSIVMAACGVYSILRPRRDPGRCGACGYNLAGLVIGPCPECGNLPRSCASSTSQPG